MAVRLGFGLCWTRLRGPAALLLLALAALFVVIVALLERAIVPSKAVDRTLLGAVFGVALPLLAYAAAERATEGRRLQDATLPLVRHGADGRSVAIGFTLGLAVSLAVVGSILAALAVVAVRGLGDPGLGSDLGTSAGIGAAAGITYAAWFALGSTWGKRGGGRAWALGLDWLFGAGKAAVAVIWPRSHVRTLAGLESAVGWTANGAWLALLILTALYASVVLIRARR